MDQVDLERKEDSKTKLPLPPSHGRDSLSYKEWLKHKDAERRLKRKLITQA